jgi:colanic acid biosynthesis protein WcaH
MFIETTLYKKIREVIPTLCVDLLVINPNNKFLLCKRSENPAKGQWWIPGGRLHKKESLIECAVRKGKEEIGVDLEIGEFVSIEETIFDNPDCHTVNIVFRAYYDGKQPLKLNYTNTEYIWLNYIDLNLNLNKSVVNPLKIIGFNESRDDSKSALVGDETPYV